MSWLRRLLGLPAPPRRPTPAPAESEDDAAEDETSLAGPADVVELPITDALDLHPFRPAETADVLRDYLDAAIERGFAEVRVIHGRGIGTQREIVRKVLSRDPRVVAFADAPADRGGWGATVVQLDHDPRPRPSATVSER